MYPLIVFVLTAITDVQLRTPAGGELGRYHVTARGDLVLAGALRVVEVTAEARQISRSTFKIAARQKLRMTDFGITPPTALFGAIRAEDSVCVVFDLRFHAM